MGAQEQESIWDTTLGIAEANEELGAERPQGSKVTISLEIWP